METRDAGNGLKSVLSMAGIIVVLWLVLMPALALALSALAGWSPFEAGAIVFVSMSFAVLIGASALSAFQLRSAGPVLVDCGHHALWWVGAVIGVSFTLASLASLQGEYLLGIPISSFYFYVAAALFGFYAASARLQVRENGFRIYHGLVPWERITAYRWSGSDGSTLRLEIDTRLPCCRVETAPLPSNQANAVAKLLEEYLPECAQPPTSETPMY